jgi:TRAP-type C4-dicarboxylate transport system permease small subunit
VALKQLFLRIENDIHSLTNVLHRISALVLFLLMLLMFFDVIGRYLFQKAITGSIDLVVIMMVIFIFSSFPDATLHRSHVRTDVLYDRLSLRKRAAIDIFTIGLCALITFLIAWQLGARAVHIFQNPPGISTSYFSWPHYPFILLAAICCGLMCLELIIWVIQSINIAIKS